MHNLTNKDYKLFSSLAKVSQESLRKTLNKFLMTKYDKIYATDDYIYAVGDIPIALVAHMDTVFKHPPKEIFYDREKGVMWSPDGLGADDRAGIFSIVRILNDGFKPTVLFCADEERGALGAEQLIRDHVLPHSPLNFIIELDRRGTNDCVFYDCGNAKFVDYIENFGFIESWGSFSDISEICPAWKVAGTNLSVGYEGEHTTSEILRVGPMLATIKKVETILSQGEWPEFKYVYNPYSYYGTKFLHPLEEDDFWGYGYGGYSYGYGYDLEDISSDDEYHYCNHCKIPLHNYELIPALDKKGQTKYYCPDCCGDFVEWCYGCGDAFEIGILNKNGLCPTCAAKYGSNNKHKKKGNK